MLIIATSNLSEQILSITPEQFRLYLAQHDSDFIHGNRPFADFFRRKCREKGINQRDVFIAADLPDRYGYKLVSEQKHTVRRDIILRICLAAEFHLDEVQEALILYGMAPMYERFPRDAAFIVAFSNRIFNIHDVEAILRDNGLPSFLITNQEKS